MQLRTIILAALCATACTAAPSTHADAHTGAPDAAHATHADAAPPDAPPGDAFASTCGQPGDQGNQLGVGKFCTTLNDCSSTPSAGLCSNLGDATTFFCTKFCTSGGAADQCGTGATCQCGNGGCGCTPDACL
jgi:hypothetical protein